MRRVREENLRVASQTLKRSVVITRARGPAKYKTKEKEWEPITNSNVASAIVEAGGGGRFSGAGRNLVMGNLVNRDYEPVLAKCGDTVNVPIPPTMEPTTSRPGGTVTPQNPSLGNAQIVPEHATRKRRSRFRT